MQQLVSLIKPPGLPSLPGNISIVIIKGLGSIAQQRPQYLGRILPTLLSFAASLKQPQVSVSVVKITTRCQSLKLCINSSVWYLAKSYLATSSAPCSFNAHLRCAALRSVGSRIPPGRASHFPEAPRHFPLFVLLDLS